MWPYMIKLNPIGLIILLLIFFSIFLIYTANFKTKILIENYQENFFYKTNDLNLNGDILMPESGHNKHNLFNDEIIKQELKLFEMVNLLELLNVIIQASQNGGTQVRNMKKKLHLKKINKGINDPLTEADLFSNQIIVGQILNSFPGIRIISEETGNKIKGIKKLKFAHINKANLLKELKMLPSTLKVALSELTIWVDPLDATQEYLENLLDYVTIMICVTYKNRPIIGVIHKPFESKIKNINDKYLFHDKSTYWAWNNIGHSKNIEKMLNERFNNINMTNLNIIVSRTHAGLIKELSKQLFNNNSKIITAGGSGYKILEIIKGNADVYLHNTLIKKWDICAPNALINEISNKKVASFTSLKGVPIDYNYMETENNYGVLATIGLNKSYFTSIFQNILN